MRNIAVITGGYSHEAQISFQSGETILTHLNKEKYALYNVVITDTNWKVLHEGNEYSVDKNDFSTTINGRKINFDCAFIGIHGTPGEDGKLQGYFDLIDIPYTTCNQLVSTLTFNKHACNTILKANGITCAAAVVLRKNSTVDAAAIVATVGLPCFVKPNDGGSSFGITRVTAQEDVEAAVSKALEHGEEAIVEAFIDGTEVTCGIYHLLGQTVALPITEIVSKNEFFDFEAKYKGLSDEITPARISDAMTTKIQSLTKEVIAILGLTGLARVDYIIQNDEPYVIEVNTVPGLSGESLIPQQAAAHGLALEELFGMMVEDAMQ